jgi:signal transduction histidine kinase/tetratricopeptide (TPR) repeat protein
MKICLLFFAILMSESCFSQKQGQALLDSLITAVATPKNDTQQIRLFNKINLESNKVNPGDDSRKYADAGMQLATKMKWDRAIAVFHLAYGDIYSNAEKRDDAIREYENALVILKKIKDSFNICIAQNNIGTVYQHNGNYTKAIDYFNQTVKLAEAFNNSYLLALGYSNIATVYTDQGNYKKAITYLEKSLKLREKDEDTENVANTLQNMGDVFLKLQDTANGLLYCNRALRTFEQTENKEGLAMAYSNLAAFLPVDSVQKKISLLLKAQSIWNSAFRKHPNSLSNMGKLGELFLWLAKEKPAMVIQDGDKLLTGRNNFLQQATFYIQKGIALSREAHGINNYAALHSILSSIEEEKGDYKNSLLHFKTFYVLTDSIYSQDNKNQIASIESQKAIDLKDKEIQLNKLALSYKQRTQTTLIAGLCLLTVIGGLLFWQSRTRKKTNTTLLQLNSELDEANKIKARFFAILSHDFRGPLSRLVHFLHLQKEDANLWTTDQAATHEKNITAAAESLLENMEDMLTWSKGQMENFKPTIHTVEVKSLFKYLDSFFVTRDNVQIMFKDPGGITVDTDENYLQTIMHNLTSNSIKALKQTSNATIIWSARQEGSKVLLSITDNGPGINAEQVKVLNDDTASLSIKTGLGFHLIRDLAKAIRCSVSLVPKDGQGTSFVLSI